MTTDAKPQTVCGDLHSLPPALTPLIERPHWVLWRWERAKNKQTKESKWTKVPYQPDGRRAKNNDPKTWNSYDTVMRAVTKFDGIGFCLRDGIAAFDIDKCRDPDTGAIHPWATSLVEKVSSYTEITISGTGLRIIGLGDGPEVQRKLSVTDGVSLEAYRRTNRYIIITGNPLPKSDVGLINIDAHIDATIAELEAQKAQEEQNKPGTPDGGQHARQEYADRERRAVVNVDALPVSDRIKNLIRGINDPEHTYNSRSETGRDPEEPNYCEPPARGRGAADDSGYEREQAVDEDVHAVHHHKREQRQSRPDECQHTKTDSDNAAQQ